MTDLVLSLSVSAPRPSLRYSWRLLGAVLLLCTLQAWAQSSSPSFRMTRQSVDGGGAAAASAGFRLHGSVGQPDAGAPATSPNLRLQGGWHRRESAQSGGDALFANGFE